MTDVLRALAISAGILLPVVILTVIISIAVVNRGAAEHAAGHGVPEAALQTKETTAPAPAKAAKAAAPAGDEINVGLILGLGVALFTLTVLLLFGLSLVQHMS